MIQLPRDVQERLIGRRVQDVLTPADRRSLAGQRVLVTGGGGSLGSELARQLATCHPARLTIFEQSEYALFRIISELQEQHPGVAIDSILGDVSRQADIRAACRVARPHAVFHAAAYKHVTLTESSALVAARTNILGTFETVRAARDVGARFLLISSDKAAEPQSVMGASKRFAELVALGFASNTFRPLAVRFGNVLGSSGSFVEIMWRCVQAGQNIPVTDPDATRFFMTAQEAVSLVLKADRIGSRGEVFWLDMGRPLRIGDLAQRFVEWAVTSGHARVGIDRIGLRPGEKMSEALTTQGLEMRRTMHPRIWSARQVPVDPLALQASVRRLRRAVALGDASGVLAVVREAVDGFIPSQAALAAARSRTPAPAVQSAALASA